MLNSKKLRALTFLACAHTGAAWAVPAPPQDLRASETPAGEIILRWESAPPTESVRIYRNGVEHRVGLHATQWVDNDTVQLSTYIYFLIACDVEGVCSQASNQQMVIARHGVFKLNTPVLPSPAVTSHDRVPSGLTFINKDGTPRLRWVDAKGSDKWNVYRNKKYVTTVVGGVPVYDIKDHLAGDEYYVTAIFDDGTISKKSFTVKGGEVPSDGTVQDQLNKARIEIAKLKRACL